MLGIVLLLSSLLWLAASILTGWWPLQTLAYLCILLGAFAELEGVTIGGYD